MRLHAIGAVLALYACGESLPSDVVPVDAGIDQSAPADAAADATDAADDVVDAGPGAVEEIAAVRPRAIAASATLLAWLQGNEVRSPAVDGGLVMTIDAGATGFLAVDEDIVIANQQSGPRSCDLASAPCADPGAPFYGTGSRGPLASVAHQLFVADRAPPYRLEYCDLNAGCGASAIVVAYMPAVATREILTSSFVVLAFEDKTVRAWLRSSRDVDAGPTLTTVNDLTGLTADGSTLYWSDGAAGAIARCSLSSCAPESVLTQRMYPRAVTVVGSSLYWIETDAGAIFRCTLPACSDPTVLGQVKQPIDMAVGDRVYVVSDSDQKIYAAAR